MSVNIIKQDLEGSSPITKDSKRTGRSREIHAHETADAGSLDFEDIVVGRDGEVVAAQSEADVWKRVTLVAFDSVLTVESPLGTDLLVEKLSKSGWEGDQRSAGVENDTSVVEISGLLAKSDGIEVDLPVRLATEGNFDQLASIVVAVKTTEGSLRLSTVIRAAEIEGEHRLVNQLLVNHVVEWWRDVVDGNRVIAQTQDAIEATKSKSQTRLAGDFSKELVFDLEVSNPQKVLGDETCNLARAVADAKLGPILLVCRRCGGIVLLMEVASDGSARGAGNPKVGAASVEHNLEFLRWRAQGDSAEVCSWSKIRR